MDYSRQINIFNPERFNTPIHVIGAGATGSWLVLMLAKLGIKDITVWDFDKVEEHNIPNQAFNYADIGQFKVEALDNIVLASTGESRIVAKKTRVDGKQRLSGIVFMLTDTMHSRKEIWEDAIRNKVNVNLLIETRMDLSDGRIYNINPLDPKHIEEYEKTLYKDEEAAVSACGASQSVVTSACTIAAWAVRQLINYVNEVELPNEILFDFMYNNIITRRFE